MTKPVVPKGLRADGKALWEALVGRYEFTAGEQPLVAAACRQVDTVAALEAKVAADGVCVAGSRGQVTVHPAVAEARQGRLALVRLLGELAIPAEEDDKPQTAASRRGQRAAAARWDPDRRHRAS